MLQHRIQQGFSLINLIEYYIKIAGRTFETKYIKRIKKKEKLSFVLKI